MSVNTWKNGDGLIIKYGNSLDGRERQNGSPRAVPTYGAEQEIHAYYTLAKTTDTKVLFTVDHDNDGVADGFGDTDAGIPYGAYLTGGYIVVDQEGDATMTVDVGLYNEDGTEVNLSGVNEEAIIAAADVSAKSVIPLNGAAISGGDMILPDNTNTFYSFGYIGLKANGNFTKGKVRVILKYIPWEGVGGYGS